MAAFASHGALVTWVLVKEAIVWGNFLLGFFIEVQRNSDCAAILFCRNSIPGLFPPAYYGQKSSGNEVVIRSIASNYLLEVPTI